MSERRRVLTAISSGVLAAVTLALYTASPVIEIVLLSLCVVVILLFSIKELRLCAVDIVVLLIVAFEGGLIRFSIYPTNTVGSFRIAALAALMFFVIRLTVNAPIQAAYLSGVVGAGGVLLGLQGVTQLTTSIGRLHENGFADLLAFRSKIITPRAPWIPGEWFTLLLLALPYSAGLGLYLWRSHSRKVAIAIVPVLLAVAVPLVFSLSRAVFWSTFAFCLVAPVFLAASCIVSRRHGARLLAGAVGGIGLILACESVIYPGLLQAYTSQHTSQARSTEGRVGIWTRSLELVRTHPLVGVGSSNAALALLSTADEEETGGFASRTFSLPLQILVEKGIIGVLLYGMFLVFLGREFWFTVRSPDIPQNSTGHPRNREKDSSNALCSQKGLQRRAMVCCFGAGLVAVLLRELTYSSLMEHSLTAVLFATLSALICRSETV